jgi:hypothetical protein
MNREALTNEAVKCRRLAPEFAGKSEEPFLLKLAAAFEQLADSRGASYNSRRTKSS